MPLRFSRPPGSADPPGWRRRGSPERGFPCFGRRRRRRSPPSLRPPPPEPASPAPSRSPPFRWRRTPSAPDPPPPAAPRPEGPPPGGPTFRHPSECGCCRNPAAPGGEIPPALPPPGRQPPPHRPPPACPARPGREIRRRCPRRSPGDIFAGPSAPPRWRPQPRGRRLPPAHQRANRSPGREEARSSPPPRRSRSARSRPPNFRHPVPLPDAPFLQPSAHEKPVWTIPVQYITPSGKRSRGKATAGQSAAFRRKKGMRRRAPSKGNEAAHPLGESIHQVVAMGVNRRLGPVFHSQLGKDVGDVGLDRFDRDEQLIRDLLVRFSLGDQFQHFH